MSFLTGKKQKSLFFIYFLLLVATCSAHLHFGAIRFTLSDVFSMLAGNQDTTDLKTIFFMRLERLLTAFYVGSGLAVAGSVLQRVLRNPLADPYVLGISAGGTTLAALVTIMGIPSILYGLPVRSLSAFGGCMFALLTLLAIKRRLPHSEETFTLPVIGFILNAFFSSILMLIVAFAAPYQLSEINRWMLGSLQSVSFFELTLLFVISLPVIFLLIIKAPFINGLSFGDEFAKTIGIDPQSFRRFSLLLVSALTALIVSISGSVGFVGLIVPHIVRTLHRKDIRTEWVASFLVGGIVLILADTFSRSVIAPAELPVGIFTALLGAPILCFVLLKRLRSRGES